MAFIGYQSTGITTEATVFTGPALTETTLIGLSIANTSATLATVSVLVNTAYVVKNAPVPVGGALVAVGADQKVVINPGDVVKVISDQAVDVITSTLQVGE